MYRVSHSDAFGVPALANPTFFGGRVIQLGVITRSTLACRTRRSETDKCLALVKFLRLEIIFLKLAFLGGKPRAVVSERAVESESQFHLFTFRCRSTLFSAWELDSVDVDASRTDRLGAFEIEWSTGEIELAKGCTVESESLSSMELDCFTFCSCAIGFGVWQVGVDTSDVEASRVDRREGFDLADL